jgi:hypothetical protein
VGIPGEEAKTKILAENPKLQVIIVPFGSPLTSDYHFNRVRIIVDESGLVEQIPRIG